MFTREKIDKNRISLTCVRRFYARLIKGKKEIISLRFSIRCICKDGPAYLHYIFAAFISGRTFPLLAAPLPEFSIEVSRPDRSLLVFPSHWNLIEIALLLARRVIILQPVWLEAGDFLRDTLKLGATTRHNVIRLCMQRRANLPFAGNCQRRFDVSVCQAMKSALPKMSIVPLYLYSILS